MERIRSIYSSWCPTSVKGVLDPLHGLMPDRIRFGENYARTLNLLKQSDRWFADEIHDYQLKEMKRLLTHAIATVPFYKKLAHDLGVDADSIRDLKAIRQFPIITKEIIRNNVEDFLSNKYNKSHLFHGTTAGTSGEPFHFYSTYDQTRVGWAFVVNLWRRVCYTPRDWRIVLRGAVASDVKKNVYWQLNHKNKELILSTYHMTDENMLKYFEIIRKGHYSFLHCHPSSAYILANFMKKYNLSYKLKAVLASSEALYLFQRKTMEEVFQCRVYSFYGQSEQVALAGECELAETFHIQPEYGITEILDLRGEEVTEDHGVGEIVATGFINDAMPLIRYRTGDHVMISSHKCPCGRNHRIIERLVGRSYDYVITKDGRIISLTGLIFAQHFSALARIKKMQLRQKERGSLEIWIVKDDGYDMADESEIRCRMMDCVKHGLELEFQYPDEIPLSSRGKHKFMIQKLELEPNAHVEGNTVERN